LAKLNKSWTPFERMDALTRNLRLELGKVLAEMRDLLAQHRNGLYGKTLEALGIPRSTAQDVVDDYERVVALGLPARVARIASDYNIDLSARRLAPALEAHKEELREAKTEDQARTVLTKVKREAKRKPKEKVSIVNEPVDLTFEALLNHAHAFFKALTVQDQAKKLQELVLKVLPELSVAIVESVMQSPQSAA